MIKLSDLKLKMPELETLGYIMVEGFLDAKNIPFKYSFFGESTIDESDAEKAVRLYVTELEEKQPNPEKVRLIREEEIKKKRAMSQMLITSGFNFDGYRITKYSGYISGDDAMSVDRGYAWGDVSVRDKLMASLTEIRRNALRELKEAAYDLGCNAVIGVDFDYITLDPQTANLSGGTTYQPYVFCVTANGNAVIIEKIED